MKALIPAALLLAGAMPVFAQTPGDQSPGGKSPAGEIVSSDLARFEAGILCAPEVVSTRPAPGTVAGVTNIIEDDPGFISDSRRVPGVLGVGFGVRAQSGIGYLPEVVMIVTHPPMGPEGATEQSFVSAIDDLDSSVTYYHLEYDYELVLGDWTMTAMSEGEVLYSVAFTVVAPQSIPELARVCGYEHLLS